ncbi:MAG: site-specific integrase [Fuerstiella sp.]|nr:site-specific integrase [Fuerstiella sp.]
MSRKIPGYLHHKARNKGKVVVDGKTIYLDGAYDSEESRRHYDRIIAELLTRPERPDLINVTLARLAVCYVEYAKTYYQKDGEPTQENGLIRSALRPLIELFSSLPVADFGPLKLKLVRERMTDRGWVRNTINDHVGRINRMLAWGVENELVPPHVQAACKAVRNLQKGRCKAPEGKPVPVVELERVEATLPFVGRQIAAMIELQLSTAMRPQEVRLMRMIDIDRSDATCWEYRPSRHKTQHHGRDRRIFLGPKAQEIISDFLKADPEAYLFCPLDAYNEANERRQAKARSCRRTPRRPVPEPKRKPRHGSHYTKESYGKAISRACEAAGVEKWSPNQLRHTAGTAIRKKMSLDDARTVLGHSDARTTEIYAERDFSAAREIMRKLG